MKLSDSYKLHIAVAALKRIKRTVVMLHCPFCVSEEDCRCPKCEAANALKEITGDKGQ